jgi:outer membrane protein TolC
MRRRFEEGLATSADLLGAEARATEMRERAINALANYHMAVAQLEFVRSQTNSEDQ